MAVLDGMRVAILATDGAEEAHIKEPMRLLQQAGARTQIVALHGGRIQAYRGEQPGDSLDVGIAISIARPENYHALLIPGGARSTQTLELRPQLVPFVQALAVEGRPVAAIGDGVALLATVGLADGMNLACDPGLRPVMENAGATFVDQDVVLDGGLVTARSTADLGKFSREVRSLFETAWLPAPPAPPPRRPHV
jgi:protease I